MLTTGCILSLGLFAVVYTQVWAHTDLVRHWLPWASLGTGLLITLHAAASLATTLGRAAHHEGVARLRTRELATHRDRSQEVLSRIRDAVVLTDPAGYVLECNEAASRTLGMTPQQIRGGHCGAVLGIRGVDRPLDCLDGCALLGDPDEQDSSFGVEVLRDREDGGTQPLLANVGAVWDGDELVEVVHSFRDITRLREADDAKTTFLATTSHELRTPLAVIRGFAETLAHRDLDAATRANALDTILRRTEQLTGMVDGLLQTSQLERRGVRLDPVLLDPVPPVLARVQDLRATFDREIRLFGDHDRLAVWADEVALGTVVEHLVENAVKYSPLGGPVDVELSRAGTGPTSVRLTVTDHGIGMDEEAAARCFDRFWQAEQGDDRRFAGTGVGLYLVRALVEGMGGRITVDSRPGEGSTFTVTLRTEPVAAVDERRHVDAVRPGSLVDEVLRHAGVEVAS